MSPVKFTLLSLVAAFLIWVLIMGYRWQKSFEKRTENLPDISKYPKDDHPIDASNQAVFEVGIGLYNPELGGDGLEIHGKIVKGIVRSGNLVTIAGIQAPIRKIYYGDDAAGSDGTPEVGEGNDVVLIVDHFAKYDSLKSQITEGRKFVIMPSDLG